MSARTDLSSVEREEARALDRAQRTAPDQDPSLAVFGRDVDAYDAQAGSADGADASVQDWVVADGARPDMADETPDGLDAYDEETRHAAEDLGADQPWEERVRAKAYELWESEGGVHGRSEDHWHLAARLVAEEDAQRAQLLPYEGDRDQPVEEGRIQENLGEFPSLTDQGDDDRPTSGR